MTVYTVIPSGDRDPESPVTPELIDGLYFNPTAITEGSSGAPKIQSAAFTAGSIATSILTGDNGITANHLAADSVRMSELYTTIGSHNTEQLGTNGVFSGEDGYYSFTTTDTATTGLMEHQVFLNGSWTKFGTILITSGSLYWIVSGSIRVQNTSGNFETVTYQRFIG